MTACINAPQEKHTSYETIALSKQSVTVPVAWSASLTGKKDVSITPRTSGQLLQVCVSEGQRVAKGQKLFVIDSREATLALQTAQADLRAAQAQESSAGMEYECNRNLFDKKIVSEYFLNSSKNDYDRAKAAVAQSKAAVANAQLQLEYCTVTSPVAGKVGAIPNNPGDQVSQMTVLTTVAGDSEMTARFSITETQLQELLKEYGTVDKALAGLPEVSLRLKDGSLYARSGRVVSIAGVVDQTTGSVVCKANFPNPDGLLYSGIQGNVVMEFSFDDAVVIPLTSVVRLQDKSLVYQVVDNVAHSVIVTVEELGNGKDAVITGGIEPGCTIVGKGAGNVYDGQQVVFPEADKKNE